MSDAGYWQHHTEQMEAFRRDFYHEWVTRILPQIIRDDPKITHRKLSAVQIAAWIRWLKAKQLTK